MDADNVKFGLETFGDLARDDETGALLTYEQSIRNIVLEGISADTLGVDIFALGEHHRKEYSISSPEMVLASLATVTKTITLGTSVTVLSSDDPIRLYQRFATLDAISNGRAQIMLGRGSFTESYPLFGFDVRDYNELFEEKIALFNVLRNGGIINWEGQFTSTLNQVEVYPKMVERKLDTLVGVGGTPTSVIRAARYGFPLMLAIIGGRPTRFKPLIELYKNTLIQYGNPIQPVGMNSIGILADTDEEAVDMAQKYMMTGFDQLSKERGWEPMTKERFDFEMEHGSYYIGGPETVAIKIARVIKEMGVQRFDLVYGFGEQLQSERFKTVELYGKEVIPRVKQLLKEGG